MLVIASVGPIVLCVFARVTEMPYVTCVQNYHNLSLTYDMPHNILPLDLWDLLHSPFRAMNGLVWYLTAFLTSTSVFSGNGEGTAAQYLLGLGEPFRLVPNLELSMIL